MYISPFLCAEPEAQPGHLVAERQAHLRRSPWFGHRRAGGRCNAAIGQRETRNESRWNTSSHSGALLLFEKFILRRTTLEYSARVLRDRPSYPVSPKHLPRYLTEFVAHNNIR